MLYCLTCGAGTEEPEEHAFETGHKQFEYKGLTIKDV